MASSGRPIGEKLLPPSHPGTNTEKRTCTRRVRKSLGAAAAFAPAPAGTARPLPVVSGTIVPAQGQQPDDGHDMDAMEA